MKAKKKGFSACVEQVTKNTLLYVFFLAVLNTITNCDRSNQFHVTQQLLKTAVDPATRDKVCILSLRKQMKKTDGRCRWLALPDRDHIFRPLTELLDRHSCFNFLLWSILWCPFSHVYGVTRELLFLQRFGFMSSAFFRNIEVARKQNTWNEENSKWSSQSFGNRSIEWCLETPPHRTITTPPHGIVTKLYTKLCQGVVGWEWGPRG